MALYVFLCMNFIYLADSFDILGPQWSTHSRGLLSHRSATRTETPTTVVTAVSIAMVVTPVPTIAMAVIETVVVVPPATTRIVTVILTVVIVVTAIAIGAGAHLLVVTHRTIVGAGAIPEALHEAVALLGRPGIMMAPTTAPAGKFALCHT